MGKRKSIKDIAQELNVAISTVSSVLNGKTEERRIGKDTERRILDYTLNAGYKPNEIARSLRTGRSNIIGMIVEDIANPFFAEITSIVEKKVAQYNYELIYSSTENNSKKINRLITTYKNRQVDGFVIAPCLGSEKKIKELVDDKMPLVLFDRYLPGLETNNVLVDNFKGIYNAMEHLMNQGYTNIGFISTNSTLTNMKDRLKGYFSFVKDHNLDACTLEINIKTEEKKRPSLINEYLLNNPELDALIFSTNYIALSGLTVLRETQKSISKQYGIISFDDNTHFDLFTPSITSIAQPIEDIAEGIIQTLLFRMKKENYNSSIETKILEPQLIIRESTQEKKTGK